MILQSDRLLDPWTLDVKAARSIRKMLEGEQSRPKSHGFGVSGAIDDSADAEARTVALPPASDTWQYGSRLESLVVNSDKSS